MKRPVKLGIASLKALGIVVVAGAVTHAGLPYLPQIGPPPLRVLAKSSSAADSKIIAAPAPLVTNLPVVVAATSSSGETNSPGSNAPVVAANANTALEETFTRSVFPLSTPDLLGITPQMLATYFHPIRFGTNAILPGPFRVSFLPPLPPDKSSHAEYNVK